MRRSKGINRIVESSLALTVTGEIRSEVHTMPSAKTLEGARKSIICLEPARFSFEISSDPESTIPT